MIKVSGKTITLRDFSLMRDGSSIYYCENFGVEDYGFGKILVPMNYGAKTIDEDTTNFSDLKIITGMESIDSGYYYMINNSGSLFFVNRHGVGMKIASPNSHAYSDILALGSAVDSKILFTSSNYVGRIHRGEATGGSTTTLVDTGVDFTTIGLVAGDEVYNTKDNVLATIDAGGIAANTLTITFSPLGGSFSSGEDYAIVDLDWNNLSASGTSIGRQIIEFDEDFYILDGDYLAMVSSAGVFSGQHKKLESGWIGKTGASNGDTIAIGCNKNYKGKIFFWDKYSNGWNKKIILDNKISSIVAYKNGYIFFSGNALWWTDGYTIRILSELTGIRELNNVSINPRGMAVIGNTIIINGGYGDYNITKKGIWIYDIIKNEWTYSPYEPKTGEEKSGYGTYSGIVYFDSYLNYIFYSFENSEYGWTNQYILSRLYLKSSSTRGTIITNPICLGKNARIKKIEVNLVQDLTDTFSDTTYLKTLTCKLSDCTRPLWRTRQASADGTVKNKIKCTGFDNVKENDEILIMDGWNGCLRRRITNIADGGTGNEEWTLDSDLTNLIKQYTTINVMPFQVYGMDAKTISDETKMLEFYPNFYGDSVMIELGITGSAYPLIAIESIKLYYE